MAPSPVQKLTILIRKGLRKRALRPILLGAIALFTIAEIVALMPSSVDQPERSRTRVADPSTFLPKQKAFIATGIPTDQIPDYKVDQFNYVSSVGSEKQWKLLADESSVYHKQNLVHALNVKAFLYDPDGKVTLITGKEAKYFTNQRDLEVFGDVVTTFPDGFQLHSEYLRYQPNIKRIQIPEQYFVSGGGKKGAPSSEKNLKFESYGFDYAMGQSWILLPKAAKVTMVRPKDPTTIDSDQCNIDRSKQIAHFTMYPSRALDNRFVHITQPTMFTKSRTADLFYGDDDQLLEYLTAYDDVLIKDEGTKNILKYATGGRADFDNKKDIIILTRFPQVYQDQDTVVGDKILMHRDTDVVEVDNSNAFSEGNSN